MRIPDAKNPPIAGIDGFLMSGSGGLLPGDDFGHRAMVAEGPALPNRHIAGGNAVVGVSSIAPQVTALSVRAVRKPGLKQPKNSR